MQRQVTAQLQRKLYFNNHNELGRTVNTMEEMQNENQDTNSEGVQGWLQDNFRIILSLIIVIAIAGGIYSYSKRTQPMDEQLASEEQTVDQAKNVEIQAEEKQEAPAKTAETKKEQVSAVATSQETDSSFVEKAGRGDGTTHLARRALANYLEKNPDSSLTAEHKIYIEDYLRKKVGSKGHVRIGTTVEFSKDLVRQAIEQSKNLNSNQLKNLHKYAVRVPSLS